VRLVVKTETQDPKRCYFAFKPKSCQCSVLGHNKAQKEERDFLRLMCLLVAKYLCLGEEFEIKGKSLPEADRAEKNRRISGDEGPDESIETHNHRIGNVEEDA